MTLEERFLKFVMPEPNSGCWLWLGALSNGYGLIGFDGKVVRAHRVSYELYCDKIPRGMFVLHKCDNPSCVNPGHLFLGTHQDNMADMISKGRQSQLKGEIHGRAKLLAHQIHSIRADNRALDKISAEYGVSLSAVSLIKTRKRWAHI